MAAGSTCLAYYFGIAEECPRIFGELGHRIDIGIVTIVKNMSLTRLDACLSRQDGIGDLPHFLFLQALLETLQFFIDVDYIFDGFNLLYLLFLYIF